MTPTQIARDFVCAPELIDDAKQAVSGLDSYPALSKFLKAKPLGALIFSDSQPALMTTVATRLSCPISALGISTDPDIVCGGLYNPHLNLVAINAGNKKDWRVQAQHRMDTLSSSLNTASVSKLIAYTVPLAQMDTVLMIHEIGHMIDYKHARKNEPLREFMQEAALSAYSSRRFVSEYAGSSPDEWFAETMTAYVVHPEVLKDFDPLAFAVMKAALEL